LFPFIFIDLFYCSIVHNLLFFFLVTQPLSCSTIFPYTTLFRSLFLSGAASFRCSSPAESSPAPARPSSALRSSRRASLRSRSRRSEEHTSELQSRFDLVCRLLLEKK